MRSGGALLARRGYVEIAEAAWESVVDATALASRPADPIVALVAGWLPSPETLREFGERAVLAGADPLAPARVAFETYGLAREVAPHVAAQLRP